MEKVDNLFELVELQWNHKREFLLSANDVIEEFEGEWFFHKGDKTKYIVSYFEGVNNFSNLKEGYLEIFIQDDTQVIKQKLPDSLKEFLNQKLLIVDFVYIEIIPPLKNDHTTIDTILELNPNLTLVTTIVEKDLKGVTEVKLDESLICRQIRIEDVDFVISCLKEAYISGLLPSIEAKVNKYEFYSNIENYYREDLLSENMLVQVALYDNEYAGHVTYSIDKGLQKADLIDLFILPKFQNKGVGKILSAWGEIECKKAGINKVFGTVDTNLSNRNFLLNNLIYNDWDISKFVFLSS